jgi:hypothetical protein
VVKRVGFKHHSLGFVGSSPTACIILFFSPSPPTFPSPKKFCFNHFFWNEKKLLRKYCLKNPSFLSMLFAHYLYFLLLAHIAFAISCFSNFPNTSLSNRNEPQHFWSLKVLGNTKFLLSFSKKLNSNSCKTCQ